MNRRSGNPQTARRIKRAIIDSELTQQYIADQLKISQPAISQIANGAVPCNARTLLKLAKVLSVDPVTLDPSLKPLLTRKRSRKEGDPYFCPICGNQNTIDCVCQDCNTSFSIHEAN